LYALNIVLKDMVREITSLHEKIDEEGIGLVKKRISILQCQISGIIPYLYGPSDVIKCFFKNDKNYKHVPKLLALNSYCETFDCFQRSK